MKLSFIALHLGCALDSAHENIEISAIVDPDDADDRCLTFVSNPKYLALAEKSKACVVIVKPGTALPGKILLEVKDPYLAFAKVALLFEDRSPLFEGPIHPTALIHITAQVHATAFVGPYSVVGKNCIVGKGTIIGAHSVIENDTIIGDDCRIDSGVIIRRQCEIGNRVIIQSGTVVGGEGFGNARDGEKFIRIPSFGKVIIEDDAELGANVTIDRGTFKPTIICKGVKIDNLVQIAHNVIVGDHTAIAAQTGVSGSTRIGKRVLVGGQAGFVGHIEIGDDAFVNAQSGVANDVEKGAKVTGTVARDFMTMRRIEAAQMQLPQLLRDVKQLRAELLELTKNRGSSCEKPI